MKNFTCLSFFFPKVETSEVYGSDLVEGEGVAQITFDVPDRAETLKVDAR